VKKVLLVILLSVVALVGLVSADGGYQGVSYKTGTCTIKGSKGQYSDGCYDTYVITSWIYDRCNICGEARYLDWYCGKCGEKRSIYGHCSYCERGYSYSSRSSCPVCCKDIYDVGTAASAAIPIITMGTTISAVPRPSSIKPATHQTIKAAIWGLTNIWYPWASGGDL
jgi:hypothetical protein